MGLIGVDTCSKITVHLQFNFKSSIPNYKYSLLTDEMGLLDLFLIRRSGIMILLNFGFANVVKINVHLILMKLCINSIQNSTNNYDVPKKYSFLNCYNNIPWRYNIQYSFLGTL